MTRTSLRSTGAGTIAAAPTRRSRNQHRRRSPELHRPLKRNKTPPDVQRLDPAYVSSAAGPAKPDGKLKRNVDVGQQPQCRRAGRCRSVCVRARWNGRRLARAREGSGYGQRYHCRCCRIWRSLSMTPYVAALDRCRHHRRRPDQAKPKSASAPIARAPSSAPEICEQQSAKKKCRRRPAAAAPPSRPVQVGLRQSSLESAPPRARTRLRRVTQM